MADPGRVYWSGKAQRFYQEGRRGSVSAKEAAGFLKYNEGAQRFIDQKNRFVPNSSVAEQPKTIRNYVGRDDQGRPFLSTTVTHETINQQTAETLLNARQIGANQQVIIRDVITDGKGNVFTVETSTVLGGRTSMERLLEQADKRDRGQLWEKAGMKSGQWQKKFLLRRSVQVVTIEKPALTR